MTPATRIWAIEALTDARWSRSIVLKRTGERTDEENRRRARSMIAFMNQSDPELLWRAVEVLVRPDGTEQATVLAHNQ